MTIRVLSFDFDGCLFNINYIYSSNKNVITHNEAFFARIKDENEGIARIITFVGSNRQSFEIDFGNSYLKGSCFPAVREVSTHLEAELDTFLLADIYGDLPGGESYRRAIDPTYKGPHAYWVFDETKATILYAQMQKIAVENPTEDIIFDFFDDRMHDILPSLRHFFETHRMLIPSNVALRLFGYEGKGVTPVANITGAGIIDINYRQTVKDMASVALTTKGLTLEQAQGMVQIRTTAHVTPDLLLHRHAVTLQPEARDNDILAEEVETGLAQPVFDEDRDDKSSAADLKQVKNAREDAHIYFDAQLRTIKMKAQALRDQGHEAAAQKAFTLYDILDTNATKYFNKELSKEAFRDICTSAISTACPELEKHQGWKQVLGNLGPALAGLGIGYVVVSLINMAITGHFLLFKPKTDSLQKLEELQRCIDQVAPGEQSLAPS